MSQPPQAKRVSHSVVSPHGERQDPYFWLRDDTRTDADVIAYLNAENAYREAGMAPHAPLQQNIYQEIVARVAQEDESVPVRQRGFWYYSRYTRGSEYPLYLRRRDSVDAVEETLLDCNVLASAHAYFSLANYEVSADNRLLAYAQDSIGRRQYSLRVKDLQSGVLLPDTLENVEPDIAWLNDNRSFLYLEKDPVTLLAVRVRQHILGTDSKQDRIVYEEQDDEFTLALVKTKSDRYILIGSESTLSSEWRCIDADLSSCVAEVILKRHPDHEYQVEHLSNGGNEWLLRTNWQAPNFRLITAAPKDISQRELWRDIVPHDPAVFIHDFSVFSQHVAVGVRSDALRKVWLYSLDGTKQIAVDFPETAYCAKLGTNVELDSEQLRFTYTSLTTPVTTYDYHLRSGQRTLLKREVVLGDFNSENYKTEMRWAIASDGEKIPLSLLYRSNTPLDGTAPLFQYGYGAYGLSSDPLFGAARLSLVDRGFVFAIAHVRGGQELGRRWYDAGRLQDKKNSFSDFVAVTDYLVNERYVAADKVFASGGSAGGLLMGVIANIAPEHYRGIVAHVPFVDIVTTMLDESIPLTTLEYDEWGNPNTLDDYRYMLSYSPYDNVSEQRYPAMLITAGFWDSQVQYFEPAKWLAKLRVANRSQQPLYLYMNMEAGHGGKSGRWQRYQEIALEYAFVLSLLGID